MAAAAPDSPATRRRPDPGAAAFGYLPALDGLRFVAFLLVFFQHNGAPLYNPLLSAVADYGWVGVEIFFAISGFLLFRLLIAEHARFGSVNIFWFYLRRACRIYPLMVFYCLTAIVYYGRTDLAALAQLSSIVLATYNYTAWFAGFATPIPHTAHLWTLAYELQIYLVIPAAFCVFKRHRATGLAVALAGVAGFCLIARAAFAGLGAPHPVIWVTPFLRPESTLLGLAVAAGLLRLPPPAVAAILAGAVGLLVSGPNVHEIGAWTIALYPICALISGLLLYAVTQTGVCDRLLGAAAIAFLGRISFGLYVYHEAVIAWVRRCLDPLRVGVDPWLGYAAQTLLALAATVVVAVLSYAIVERPFLRIKAHITAVPSRPV
jgi:peptidoglycan/LPS O-acetylase OafA/YrhL